MSERMLLPTTVVGSYPQPDWLIDRRKPRPSERRRACARARCGESPSRGSNRPRTTPPSSRFTRWKAPVSTSSATARCAARATPTGSPTRSAASTASVRVARSVAADAPTSCRWSRARFAGSRRSKCATSSFLRAHTTRKVKITLPGPFTMTQQAENAYYPDAESLAMAYAEAVNERNQGPLRGRRRRGAGRRALYAGAPGIGPALRAERTQSRAGGRWRDDRRASVFRLRLHHEGQAGGLFVFARARELSGRPDVDRGRATQTRSCRFCRNCPPRPSSWACSTSTIPRSRAPRRSPRVSARRSNSSRPSGS